MEEALDPSPGHEIAQELPDLCHAHAGARSVAGRPCQTATDSRLTVLAAGRPKERRIGTPVAGCRLQPKGLLIVSAVNRRNSLGTRESVPGYGPVRPAMSRNGGAERDACQLAGVSLPTVCIHSLGLIQSYSAITVGMREVVSFNVVSMRKFDAVRWRSAKKKSSG